MTFEKCCFCRLCEARYFVGLVRPRHTVNQQQGQLIVIILLYVYKVAVGINHTGVAFLGVYVELLAQVAAFGHREWCRNRQSSTHGI